MDTALIDRTRSIGMAMALTRGAAGVALIAAPRRSVRSWTGLAADTASGRLLARTLGVRDLAIGVGTLTALDSPHDTARMLRLGAASDLGDAAASWALRAHLDPRRRRALPLVSVATAAIGFVAAGWAQRMDRTIDLTDGRGEIRASLHHRDAGVRDRLPG